ncbi:MAG TPA: protocatechuate 3,4-dioxygenase subunit alpha [Acidimicrobiales bacterium]|nr:protocatechuate 3,4-dioxygenase subunit alpha [Acidimicrobiales bacterium]
MTSPLDHPDIAPQVRSWPEPSGPTPSQTVGPFFSIGLAWMCAEDLVPADHPGAIGLTGRVLDGAGAPVPDAVVEIWQADADGALESRPGWLGFGRSMTDAGGVYRFTTVRPGAVAGGAAPHIAVNLFARGLLQRLATRIYLPGEPANESDAVLQSVDPIRRSTLIARDEGTQLAHDFRLQGDRETVFFVW